MADIKIDVETTEVGDPKIPIYKITIRGKVSGRDGIWEETYGSREATEAFLQGLKAAFSLTDVGGFEIPTIPKPSPFR